MVEEAERAVILQATLAAVGVKEPEHPRERLEKELGVPGWRLPGQAPSKPVVREPGAPDWWVSDRESSDSFLQAMGVKF
jgi:hypothetical protein